MYGRAPRYISLFSGIGGFELGIGSRAECTGFSEIDKYAIQIYQRHFPDHPALGDVTKLDVAALPDFDMLVGGFPCQAFSVAGKRGGFSDTRGTLFFEIARIARAKRPRVLFLENVKGLLSHDEGRTFHTIITALDELGYDLQWQVLNSKDFGVPQNRERVFIVGHLRGEPRPQVFPLTNCRPENPPPRRHDAPGTQEYIATRHLGRNGGLRQPDAGALQASEVPHLTDGRTIRRLTPTECERLQGFPDGWTEGITDTQRYKCLGNAVTVNVIAAIASELF